MQWLASWTGMCKQWYILKLIFPTAKRMSVQLCDFLKSTSSRLLQTCLEIRYITLTLEDALTFNLNHIYLSMPSVILFSCFNQKSFFFFFIIHLPYNYRHHRAILKNFSSSLLHALRLAFFTSSEKNETSD